MRIIYKQENPKTLQKLVWQVIELVLAKPIGVGSQSHQPNRKFHPCLPACPPVCLSVCLSACVCMSSMVRSARPRVVSRRVLRRVARDPTHVFTDGWPGRQAGQAAASCLQPPVTSTQGPASSTAHTPGLRSTHES